MTMMRPPDRGGWRPEVRGDEQHARGVRATLPASCSPSGRNIVVWYRPLDIPPPCFEFEAWPCDRKSSFGRTPPQKGVRAAMDALTARVWRGRHGEYLLTSDDIPFSRPVEWPLFEATEAPRREATLAKTEGGKAAT
jgi:hypothetical protein